MKFSLINCKKICSLKKFAQDADMMRDIRTVYKGIRPILRKKIRELFEGIYLLNTQI